MCEAVATSCASRCAAVRAGLLRGESGKRNAITSKDEDEHTVEIARLSADTPVEGGRTLLLEVGMWPG